MTLRILAMGPILAFFLAGCASDDAPQVAVSDEEAAASVGALPPERTRQATGTLQDALSDRGSRGALGSEVGR